ncbi:hypothetical protein [Knoellia aerolata]|uniref:Uncharacterized protein n=1 Tax=Knoellia aerolata DSM 18566 TaxID=1385519 RepID=A0A0A0JTF5_9MICO|nr:hypothetical protein [Knoellia aerolata]KGN40705.1 hypothetical protein N801_12790 [Knoellia aerolata DSM 18566]
MSTRVERVLLLTIAGVAAVGLVDAALVREPDLVVLFAGVVVLCFVWFLLVPPSRRRLTTRADLFAWLQARSDLTGEPVGRIADRALATYRRQLEGVGTQPQSGSTGVDAPTVPSAAREG